MSTNKTIAKNTLFLYLRMLFTMGVSLYTARVILQVLGLEDFGIYKLIDGVVVLFSFLTISMNMATQRFLNVEKALGSVENVKKIFNVSLVNHFFIAILVLVLAETFGLWFLNNILIVPSERMAAANIVYQLSLISTLVFIMQIPLGAMIIAYERMSYFAYLGVFEAISKLIVAYLLMTIPSVDHMIFYTLLLMLVNVSIFILQYVYCRKNFRHETSFAFYRDWGKTKEMLSFSGWVAFGRVADVGSTQGLNMLLNIFYGVIVNAATGIAGQINSVVLGFVSNFQTAFRPQVIHTYASEEYEKHKKLVLSASKYSLFLMAFITAPILFFTHSVLQLWLGDNLPEYVEGIVQIVIFCTLLDAMGGAFTMSAMAIGVVKVYFISIALISFLNFPLAYILLKQGVDPPTVFIGKFCISVVLQLFRYYFATKYLGFRARDFVMYGINVTMVFGVLAALQMLSDFKTEYTWIQMIWGSLIIEVVLIGFLGMVGLNKTERGVIFNFIAEKIKKKY